MTLPFDMYFSETLFFGALAGLASTATAIVVKENLGTVMKGVFVGSLILGAAWIAKNMHDYYKIHSMVLEDKIKSLSSRLEDYEKENKLLMLPRLQIEKIIFQYIMSDNKLVTIILYAATLTGIAAGIGWIAKKVAKENFTPDPSSNVMNYAKFTAVMAGSIGLKKYLEDQKILPV